MSTQRPCGSLLVRDLMCVRRKGTKGKREWVSTFNTFKTKYESYTKRHRESPVHSYGLNSC